MVETFPILAFQDNYIWVICNPDSKNCIIVDPGISAAVLETLKARGLNLTAIFVTHHHYDHTGGIHDILQQHQVPVYASSLNTKADHPVSESSRIHISGFDEFKVVTIPGHTLDHIAYFNPDVGVFCGDTLFTAGCGKIFEGTVEQMYSSLSKLAALPDPTLVYCGHEYTANNLKFAQLVEPNNQAVKKRIEDTQKKRAKNQPTVPSTLTLEKETNPFLRCDQKQVIQSAEAHCGRSLSHPVDVLGVLRDWKNHL